MKNLWNDIKWLYNYTMSILMYAIIVIFIIIGIVLLAYYVDYKRRSSNLETPLYGAYVIVSGSMEPIIKIKDAVVIRRAEEDDIKVGDVVTYRSMDPTYYGILITHRVVEIRNTHGQKIFVTKGDSNITEDRSPIVYGQIYGKVVMRIPKIGYIKSFLVSSYGWIIAIVVPSLGVIIYDIMKLIKNIKSNKKNELNNNIHSNDTNKDLNNINNDTIGVVKGKKVIDFEE